MEGEPVRVKAYGLRYFTKQSYVKLQAVVFGVFGLLLVFALTWQPTGVWANNFIFANLKWLVPLFIVLELAETGVMLQKFKQKERAMKRAQPRSK